MHPTPRSLSVVVPLYNEEASLVPLVDAVRQALATHPDWELILIDDGSSDATGVRAAEIAAADPRVRLVRLARNYGQTAAMREILPWTPGKEYEVVTISIDPNEGFDLARKKKAIYLSSFDHPAPGWHWCAAIG